MNATSLPQRLARSATPTVGVNLLWLVPGVVGGSEEYTMRLLLGLAERSTISGSKLRVRLYCRPELLASYPELSQRYECRLAPTTFSDRMPSLAAKAVRVALEMSWLAHVSRRDALLHHAGGVVPSVRSQPAIVTLHDLQPLEMPQNFSVVKRFWLTRRIPRSVEAARLVICPSEFTAQSLQDRFDVRPAKVCVVPHGFVAGPALALGDELPAAVRGRRFLLYPAIAYHHKRHCDAIAMMSRLVADGVDVDLVLTGGPGPCDELVDREIEHAGLTSRIHRLGRVPRAQLDLLYVTAAALVFPSAYEGFGNPVLEAMSAGCPVVAARAGALPEIVGEAGLVVDVGDIDGMASAVQELLNDEALNDGLREAGYKRAASFSVETAAEALESAYLAALGVDRIDECIAAPIIQEENAQ